MRIGKTVKGLLDICESWPDYIIDGGGNGGDLCYESYFYYDPIWSRRYGKYPIAREVKNIVDEYSVPMDAFVGIWDADDNHIYCVCNFVIDHDVKAIVLSIR